jgi:glycosyltransferase involved in cell wall biosynthesis
MHAASLRVRARTGIVIPCFNESQRLNGAAIEAFLARQADVVLLCVDDGSRDATPEILTRLSAACPGRVHAWRLEENCGKAEAVRRGILRAAELGFRDIGFWDADLATPLEAIPHFAHVLDRRETIQVVWGTRLPLLGHRIDRDAKRRLLGRLFSTASAIGVNVGIRDALCGAKLFRNSPALLSALFGSPFASRWIFDVEILSRLVQHLRNDASASLGETLFEFPLEQWDEVPGSKVRLKDFIRAAFEMAALACRHRFLPAPAADARMLRAERVRLLDLTAAEPASAAGKKTAA